MLQLERALASKLTGMRVRIEVPDGDTVVLHNVPANRRFFNKARTNLLLKRPHAGMPFVTCVDDDLEYVGPEPALTRVFCGGIKQAGWRTLGVACPPQTDLHQATETALSVLGFDGREPTPTPPDAGVTPSRPGGVLANYSTDLSQAVRDSTTEPTVGRADATDAVASCVLRWGQTRLCVIIGESGVGKTNLLYAVARKLTPCRGGFSLSAIDLADLLAGTTFEAEQENLLSALLKEMAATPASVLALEHLDLALRVPCGPLLLAQAADAGTRIIGTTLPGYAPLFRVVPLARRVTGVELPELSPGQTLSVLRALEARIARHHGVEIANAGVRACVQAAQSFSGHFPAKAVALLDAACARAAVSAATMIGPDDIYAAAGRCAGA